MGSPPVFRTGANFEPAGTVVQGNTCQMADFVVLAGADLAFRKGGWAKVDIACVRLHLARRGPEPHCLSETYRWRRVESHQAELTRALSTLIQRWMEINQQLTFQFTPVQSSRMLPMVLMCSTDGRSQ